MVDYSGKQQSRYWDIFPQGTKRTFFVIHAVTEKQVMHNYHIAKKAGADGVFLINHGDMSNEAFIETYKRLRQGYKDDFIGINFLNFNMQEILEVLPLDVSALLMDDGSFGKIDDKNRKISKENWEMLRGYREKTLLFSGIYFKGTGETEKPISSEVIEEGALYSDCLVTSGLRTGFAPKPEKIQAVKNFAGDHPVGNASGMNIENISLFSSADFFLVSTGICIDPDEFDEGLAMQFVARVGAMAKEEA